MNPELEELLARLPEETRAQIGKALPDVVMRIGSIGDPALADGIAHAEMLVELVLGSLKLMDDRLAKREADAFLPTATTLDKARAILRAAGVPEELLRGPA